ncbi:MFS transporter [Actinoplanes sp. Pm04-4]|uniref:MFS transporter n=1 Tax=Paractinoplanes pyxinae TaxID=2997416 RepID=A0ABT4BC39_9ACTN|nr:MFS transporter [Actinoplanes pyxinae]MCY1144083.1 MFS transporter [Actinoplanes pyxinae]
MKLPAGLELLRAPGFRAYLLGMICVELAVTTVQVALPFAIFSLGGGPGDVGVALGVGVIPRIGLVLFGGVAGDRFSRRTVLLVTTLFLTCCQAVGGGILLGGGAGVWTLIVLQTAYGAALAFVLPTLTGIVLDVAPKDSLLQANSLVRLARNSSAIAGPSLAGIVVAVANPGWAYVVSGIAFACALIVLRLMPKVTRPQQAGGESMRRELLEGWSAFSGTPWIWLMVASFALYQATMMPAIMVGGPTVAESTVGVSGWATVLTARSLGAIIVGFLLLRWRPARPLLLATLILLLDIPFVLALVYNASLIVLLAAAILSAAALNVGDTLWETTLQERVDSHMLSRVSSYDWLGSLAFAPLGFLVLGLWIQHAGMHNALLAVAALHAAVHIGIALLPQIRRALLPGPVTEAVSDSTEPGYEPLESEKRNSSGPLLSGPP